MDVSPKVSVIIPNYNHAQYLTRRIESVLSQTYTNFEIIILDDASNDNSVDIISQYKCHPKIKQILFSTTNSGNTFFQWKKGLDCAIGEYIWIAESDDLAAFSFLEVLTRALDDNPTASVAFCPTYWIDSTDRKIYTPSPSKKKLFDGADFICKEFILGNAIPNASMAVFRKDAIRKVNFDDVFRFRYCGDWFFWVLLINDSDVYQHDEALNYYRRHSQSVSISSEKEGLFFLEGLLVLNQIKKMINFNTKEYLLISKKWGFKLFKYKREHSKIKKSILKVFLKYLPFGLLFFALYSIKYYRRLTQT